MEYKCISFFVHHHDIMILWGAVNKRLRALTNTHSALKNLLRLDYVKKICSPMIPYYMSSYQTFNFFTYVTVSGTDKLNTMGWCWHGTKLFQYRFQDFFPIPNFSDTGSETFFRYQIFPILVPIPPEKWNIPSIGTYTVTVPIINLQNS